MAATPVAVTGVPQFLPISNNASGDTDLITGVAGKSIVVGSYTLVPPVSTAVTVTWKSKTTGAVSGAMPVGGTGNAPYLAASDPHGLFQTVAGETLTMTLSGANLVTGHLTYWLQ